MFGGFPRCIRTGRLDLAPVWGGDLPDLLRLKEDPRAFGLLLGGVRTRERTVEELAEDIAFWSRHRVGMWSIRERVSRQFIGMTGIMRRGDGRGMALRFALDPHKRGRGYASEAAGAALRYAHERGGLALVIAVARETNVGSREVLGAIGMVERGAFLQRGWRMIMYESRANEGFRAETDARVAA